MTDSIYAPAVTQKKDVAAKCLRMPVAKLLMVYFSQLVFMRLIFTVALYNRADHYIFMLWFVLLLLLSCFFPRLISAAADWMSAILPHMVWP